MTTETAVTTETTRIDEAFRALDPNVAQQLTAGLSTAIGQGPRGLAAFMDAMAKNYSPAVAKATAMLMRDLAQAYESAGGKLEDRIERIQSRWLRAVATAAEDASEKQAHREREVRNLEVLLRTAAEGLSPDDQSLALEVLNASTQKLIEDPAYWTHFESMLMGRNKSALWCDAGFNVVGFPIELADPKASDDDIEATAQLIEKLARLGRKTNTVFFVDLYFAGQRFLQSNSVTFRDQASRELTQLLDDLSWTNQLARLGKALSKRFSENDLARFLVVNGGVGLLADREIDTEFKGKKAPLMVSNSAAAIGAVAFSTGRYGVPAIASGSGYGTGGVVGVSKVFFVPVDEHQEKARKAGVNIAYVPVLNGAAAMDSSVTLGYANPAVKAKGAVTVESILVAQFIQRMSVRYLRQMKLNTPAERQKVVAKLNAQLAELRARGTIQAGNAKDMDELNKLQEQGKVDIRVEYVESAMLDRAHATVQRTIGGSPNSPTFD